jgi:predicted nucleic acid-binding protein
MLASAVEANCTIFYTEDLHHGHKIGNLTIRNPFKRAR